ncbi:RLA class II histocompatibility antigen, DP alpha-1 chain-like [Rana temporaria]|uniref:RLA class II histocompatibility antigen, DP alpha-1 chain-like n=1 Tax=Rana temporaria TaxID=8407 RepID=UPI001AAD7388|nr:RLA class II histocompatibility antigen, DP alpha-1 chain-like [Rana temporaria]
MPAKKCVLLMISVFCLHSGEAVKRENVLTQAVFYQTLEPSGEYMFQFDKDEIFYVDLDKKQTVWRLPQFGEVAGFEAAAALQNMAVLKHNLDSYKQRSNFTEAKNVPPEVHVFPESSVIVGEPNILICLGTKFFPPVIKMSWQKNSVPVTEGVSMTDFYPTPDGSFSKFLYLTTIPQDGEVYTCSVEHAGKTTNTFWHPEVSKPISEATENVICGLGLLFGMCGVIAAIVLICKGMKSMNQGRGH